MTDVEFIRNFYPDLDSMSAIKIIGIRRLLAHQLVISNVLPNDNLPKMFPDIPFDEVIRDVCEYLGIDFSFSDYEKMDGTVNSIISWALIAKRENNRKRL